MSGTDAVRHRSFAPMADADARVLILGSMPGTASLAARQYYAHPYNQFWPIMEHICGAVQSLPYAERLRMLQQNGIALWDVLHSCVRSGSLDTAIEHASAVPNDLMGLMRAHQRITLLCCNGTTAYRGLQRYFGTQLQRERPELRCLRLPSTSPAHASMRFADKLRAWQAALRSA